MPTTGGHREVQLAERVADGVDQIAHGEGIAVAEADGLEAVRVDLEHGDVVVFLIADDRGGIARAVVEDHVDVLVVLRGQLDHVVVGEDITVLRDDEARAGHGGGAVHAEEVGVGHLGGDADDLRAGLGIDRGGRQSGGIVLYRRRGLRVVGAAGRGCLGDPFERLLGPGVLERGDPAVETAPHEGGADETAQQRADETERDDTQDPAALAAFFMLLGLFRLGRRVITRRDGAFARGGIMGVGVDALFGKLADVAVFAFALLFGRVVFDLRIEHKNSLFFDGMGRLLPSF